MIHCTNLYKYLPFCHSMPFAPSSFLLPLVRHLLLLVRHLFLVAWHLLQVPSFLSFFAFWFARDFLTETLSDAQFQVPVLLPSSAISNKCHATRNKCLTSSNRCLTSSNKKLLGAKGIATNGARTLLGAPRLDVSPHLSSDGAPERSRGPLSQERPPRGLTHSGCRIPWVVWSLR